MQKQSKYEILAAPVFLERDWPLEISPVFHQADHAITFLHRHNHMEFGLCLAGTGIFIVGSRVINFHAGDIMAIPVDMPHLAQSTTDTQSSWIWIYLDIAGLVMPYFPNINANALNTIRHDDFPCRISAVDPEFAHLLRNLQQLPRGDRESAGALALLLLRRLSRYCPVTADTDAPPEARGWERIQAALQYFSTHYRSSISFCHAARICHISPVHFRRLFKEALGVTPQFYIHSLRIAMAKAELQDSSRRSIEEIAGSCGYSTLSSFNRQFKAHAGTTPSEYRHTRQ